MPQTQALPLTPALELSNVSKHFQQPGQETVIALDDVSLCVQQGEFLVIVGHNGSGKTTLLDIVAGNIAPDSGDICFADNRNTPATTQVARVRQSPGDGTFADLTVCENFQLSLLQGMPSPLCMEPSTAVLEEASRRLQPYGLDNKLSQRVSDLSQGQRQLLALELAMSRQPDILILDEHTASLDRKNAASCMEATARLVRESNTTVLMVTHHLTDAIEYGDILVILKDGRIVDILSGKEKEALSLPELMRQCGFVGS